METLKRRKAMKRRDFYSFASCFRFFYSYRFVPQNLLQVTIYRIFTGLPISFAQDLEGLYYGFGYATAQDRADAAALRLYDYPRGDLHDRERLRRPFSWTVVRKTISSNEQGRPGRPLWWFHRNGVVLSKPMGTRVLIFEDQIEMFNPFEHKPCLGKRSRLRLRPNRNRN